MGKGREMMHYATAESIGGTWTYRGALTGMAENSFTIHPGIVEFKGQWYLFYHNASLVIGNQAGATGRRSVLCGLSLLYAGWFHGVRGTDGGQMTQPPKNGWTKYL